jgi:hypothetical protein
MESLEVAAEDVLCGKGYELVLFLFTDILLVAKKKAGKIGGMMRSPSTASLAANQASIQSKVRKYISAPNLRRDIITRKVNYIGPHVGIWWLLISQAPVWIRSFHQQIWK